MKMFGIKSIVLISFLIVNFVSYSQPYSAQQSNPINYQTLCYLHDEYIGMANTPAGCVYLLTNSQLIDILKTHSNPMDCIVTVPFLIWNFN